MEEEWKKCFKIGAYDHAIGYRCCTTEGLFVNVYSYRSVLSGACVTQEQKSWGKRRVFTTSQNKSTTKKKKKMVSSACMKDLFFRPLYSTNSTTRHLKSFRLAYNLWIRHNGVAVPESKMARKDIEISEVCIGYFAHFLLLSRISWKGNSFELEKGV